MTGTTSNMTPQRWERLQEIFDRALAIDPATRAEYIASACGEDLGLREQVLALVFASGAADSDFEDRIDQVVAASARDAVELAPGSAIGNYRILEVIGRGGMGTVYLAERADEQYEQRVAIKVMALSAAPASMAARFRAERQILANLVHPNISRLLDGGTTAAGLSYFVMEHIEGEPIDQYCDRQRVAIGARLDLLRKVCEAVHFAHRNLVVHRDLKPSNILVTAEGVVKLLDFGIAKLLRPEALPHTVAVTAAARLLTPEHASPEQIRGEPITTASDVYSLGVLAYHLLCGRMPYHARSHTAGEIERAILERAPVQPSLALFARPADPADSQIATPETIAAARATVPERLRQELRGDLDTIVLFAMRKEPNRRYGSAQALADDIERHQRSLPVTAQPDSLGYRAAKFAGRHRMGLVAGTAMAFAVIALTVLYTLRLAAERDRATAEATKAQMVAGFLTGIFEQADPASAQGRPITALDLLDHGAREIETSLADQPLVRADLMQVIGHSYMSLGAYDRAVSLIDRALDIRKAQGRDHTPEYARALYDMAGLMRFQAKYVEAEKYYRDALEIQQRLYGEPHGDTAATLTHLAILYYEMQRFEESVTLQRQALAMTREAFGDGHTETANRLSNLALPLQELGQYGEAERALREAVSIQVAALGPRHPDSLTYRYNLALLLRAAGRYAEAERELRDVLESRRAVLGEMHPRVTTAMSALGGLLTTLGRFDESEQLLEQALALDLAKLGPTHFRVGNVLRNLGGLELARGRAQRAEHHFRRSLEIDRATYGESSNAASRTETLVGVALLRQDRHADAQGLLEKAVAALRESVGEESHTIARSLEALAELRVSQSRLDDAARLYGQALANYERIFGADHPSVADPLIGLADIELRRARPDLAEPLCRRALDILQPRFTDRHWRTAMASALLGRSLLASGNRAEGERLMRASHAVLVDKFGAADARTRSVRDALDEALKPARARSTALTSG